MALLPKKLLTTQNLLLGAGIAIALYFGYQYVKGQQHEEKKKSTGSSVVGDEQIPKTDPHLDLNVSPSIAIPGVPTTIMISGLFKGDDGSPSPAQMGYYAIYDSQNRMITQGTLGSNVTSFSRPVVIPPLPNGEFMVSVSDEPIVLSPGSGYGGGSIMPYPYPGQYGGRHHHRHHHRGGGQQQQGMLPQTPQSLNISLQSPTGAQGPAGPAGPAGSPAPTATPPPMTQQQQIYPPSTTGSTDTTDLQPLTPGVI